MEAMDVEDVVKRGLFSKATPVVPVRAVHLDLKGLPPTPQRLVELVDVFAATGHNAILVEWEDAFPWTIDKRFRSETVYTPDDVQAFHDAAGRAGLEIIPLIQSLGHLSMVLGLDDYAYLREVPHRSESLNPLKPEAGELVIKMVDDVLALTPNVQRFHLGGDESWTCGTARDTKLFVETHGLGELYMVHIEPVLDHLSARGIRPLLWHDMMIHWSKGALQALAPKADLVVWGYDGHPDETDDLHATKHIEVLAKNGLTLWGATAYKGADGLNADLPSSKRFVNAVAWVEVAQRFGFAGIFNTAWSRYNANRCQCEPIDAALDSLVITGSILHDGEMPEDPGHTSREFLDSIGEGERFARCKKVMQELTAARKSGWESIQPIRELLATYRIDPRRRRSDFTRVLFLGDLRKAITQIEKLQPSIMEVFSGLVKPVWMEHYIFERLEPLREEMVTLRAILEKIDAPHLRDIGL